MAKQSIDTLAAVVLGEVERHAPHLNPDLQLLVLGKAASIVRVRVAELRASRERDDQAAALAERDRLERARAIQVARLKKDAIARQPGEPRGKKTAFPGIREEIRKLQTDPAFMAVRPVIRRAYDQLRVQYTEQPFMKFPYFMTLWCEEKRKAAAQ